MKGEGCHGHLPRALLLGWVFLATTGCPAAEQTAQPAATVTVFETVELDLFRDTPIVSCGHFKAADTYRDADGNPRILRGNTFEFETNGQAQLSTLDGQRLIAGEQSSCDTIWTVEGSDENVGLGIDVTAADLDGDGLPESLVADPQRNLNGSGSFGPGVIAILPGGLEGDHSFDDVETLLFGDYNDAGSGIMVLLEDGSPTLIAGAEANSGQDDEYGFLYLLPSPSSGGQMEDLASGIIVGPGGGTFVPRASDHDLTGDGLADVVASDALYGGWAGLTLIYESPLGLRTEAGDAVATIAGEPGSVSGYALSTGDSDGDGHADLLLGAINEDDMEGAAYLLYGPLAGDLQVSQADASFRPDPDPSGAWNPAYLGRALSLDQDLDGDGRADPAIGVPGHEEDDISVGGAYVWLGPVQGAQGPATAAAHLFVAPDRHVAVGTLLLGLPDVDGDGLDDLLVYGAYSKESEDEYEPVFFLLRSVDL